MNLDLGPSRYQVPGTFYGNRYFNPVETGVVPLERYQVLPETGVVLAVEMCRILVPGTWDRDGPKNGTTPVAELIRGQRVTRTQTRIGFFGSDSVLGLGFLWKH